MDLKVVSEKLNIPLKHINVDIDEPYLMCLVEGESFNHKDMNLIKKHGYRKYLFDIGEHIAKYNLNLITDLNPNATERRKRVVINEYIDAVQKYTKRDFSEVKEIPCGYLDYLNIKNILELLIYNMDLDTILSMDIDGLSGVIVAYLNDIHLTEQALKELKTLLNYRPFKIANEVGCYYNLSLSEDLLLFDDDQLVKIFNRVKEGENIKDFLYGENLEPPKLEV